MIVLMTFAAVVCVVQLAVVGSWARSLRIVTLLQGIGVGFMLCGPLAVAIQWAWTRAAAAVGPWSLGDVVNFAGWTGDPLIEEVVKILPLVVLAWQWPRVQRQLGWVDHLLVGAALGAGFELFEAALRFSRLGLLAMPTGGGFIVRGGLSGAVVVPSSWTSLTTWQPAPASFQEWLSSGGDTVQHLVWTALAALGVAWVSRRRDGWRWVGVVPLLVVWLDHANYNAVAASVPLASTWASTAISWVGYRLAGLVVLALIALTIVDRWTLATARRGRGDVLLSGEPANGLDPRRLLHLAVLAPPWSTSVTWAVVLARRAALTGSVNGVAAPALLDKVPALVARLQRAGSAHRWRAGAARLFRGVDPRALLSWRAIVWLVGLLPAAAYLIVGGFPATQDLQKTMTGTVGLWSIAIGTITGAVLVALQVPGLVRAVRARVEPVLHEVRIRPAARLSSAGPSLVLAAFVLAAVAVGHRPTESIVSNYHALDALSSTEFILGLALLALSFVFFPPAAAFMLTTAGTAVLTESGLALAIGSAAGLSLVSNALLNQASDPGRSDSGGGQTSGGGSDFDYDPYDPSTGEWFDPEVGPSSPPPRITGYRPHALERLELRGFTRQQVEDLLSSPPDRPVWQPGPGTWLYVGRDGLEVTVNLAGRVVSAMD